MQSPRYALVAYVRNAVGELVENLRQELHPDLPHLAAHVTILPPRRLQGGELSALDTLEDICGQVEPFEVTLGDVETFVREQEQNRWVELAGIPLGRSLVKP